VSALSLQGHGGKGKGRAVALPKLPEVLLAGRAGDNSDLGVGRSDSALRPLVSLAVTASFNPKPKATAFALSTPLPACAFGFGLNDVIEVGKLFIAKGS